MLWPRGRSPLPLGVLRGSLESVIPSHPAGKCVEDIAPTLSGALD
jgi:hypothetical protein